MTTYDLRSSSLLSAVWSPTPVTNSLSHADDVAQSPADLIIITFIYAVERVFVGPCSRTDRSSTRRRSFIISHGQRAVTDRRPADNSVSRHLPLLYTRSPRQLQFLTPATPSGTVLDQNIFGGRLVPPLPSLPLPSLLPSSLHRKWPTRTRAYRFGANGAILFCGLRLY